MKSCNNLFKTIGFSLFSSFLVIACVNNISEEEDHGNSGDIPLRFTAAIHEATATRASNNQFMEGDSVGLFVLTEKSTMIEERYADNLCFVRSADNLFQPRETVYYPDEGVALHLLSYYPYQKEGVPMGESKLPVSVSTHQDNVEQFEKSDFLVASQENVTASKEAIALTYEHQFFRLKISLVPGEGESLGEMSSLDISLSMNGLYTKASYDFQQMTLADYADEAEITSAGTWKEEKNELVGKEFILIPQEATAGYQYITLRDKNKSYTCLLPSSLKLQSGKQSELKITFVSSSDILMSELTTEISDWETSDNTSGQSAAVHNYVDVSKISFEASNVYKVLYNRTQVAEICKEYLLAPGIAQQAIVVYPVKDDGLVDLSKGVVAQLLGVEGKVHGGSVAWDTEDNSLTYVPGTSLPSRLIYVLANRTISLSVTTKDEVLPVLALADVVRDVRGGEIKNYPLVKIATQYWMRDNLATAHYSDGSDITQLTEASATAGYLKSSSKTYFYTAAIALFTDFLPAHWGIPTWKDWNLLKTYLKGDAALLKEGTWIPLMSGYKVTPVNNLSGFNALPVGICVGKNIDTYEHQFVDYWTVTDTGTAIAEKLLYLQSDSSLIRESNPTVDTKAHVVRCIRRK